MVLADNLVSYWKLNEAAGSTRLDSIGTDNDLSEVGGNVSQGSPLVTGSDPNSADFGGSSNYLRDASPSGLPSGSGSFTIACWARLEGNSGDFQGLVCKFTPTGNQRQFALVYHGGASNTYRFGVSSNGSDDFSVNDDDSSVLNETHFIIAFYDGDADTVNIQTNNGTISSVAGPTTIHNGTAGLDIGTIDVVTNEPFEGRIDEVGIWTRLLSTEEKTALYNSGDGGTYPFNDIPICWNYTAPYRGSSKTYKVSGPGPFPRCLRVPGNVDATKGVMVDDGILIDPDEYEVI